MIQSRVLRLVMIFLLRHLYTQSVSSTIIHACIKETWWIIDNRHSREQKERPLKYTRGGGGKVFTSQDKQL